MAPTGYINHEMLAKEVERVRLKLGPEVVRLRYQVGPDTGGDPSIYFRIVLTDSASREEKLFEVTQPIIDTIEKELHPLENWGLYSYFRFRSQSEQAPRNDAEWA